LSPGIKPPPETRKRLASGRAADIAQYPDTKCWHCINRVTGERTEKLTRNKTISYSEFERFSDCDSTINLIASQSSDAEAGIRGLTFTGACALVDPGYTKIRNGRQARFWLTHAFHGTLQMLQRAGLSPNRYSEGPLDPWDAGPDLAGAFPPYPYCNPLNRAGGQTRGSRAG
jgi:hypothetical protein